MADLLFYNFSFQNFISRFFCRNYFKFSIKTYWFLMFFPFTLYAFAFDIVIDIKESIIRNFFAIEVPTIEVPAIEVPAIEVPAIEVQAIEVPAIEVPAIEIQAIEVPAIEVPAIEVPAIEVPAIEVPAIEVPAIEVEFLAIVHQK